MKNKITWEVKDQWDVIVKNNNIGIGDSTNVNANNINANFSYLEERIENIEKLLKKIEQFLNKFFDTEINKEKP
jgi:hypothetical protein